MVRRAALARLMLSQESVLPWPSAHRHMTLLSNSQPSVALTTRAKSRDTGISRFANYPRRWLTLSDRVYPRRAAEDITRLLVVDDNVDVRFAMYECLSAEGYDVAVAADGIHALALARVTAPHAILLDIGMPEFDGFSTARALRGMGLANEALMVAVTGFSEREHVDNARQSGFDFYFQKPVEIEALLDLLKGELTGQPTKYARVPMRA